MHSGVLTTNECLRQLPDTENLQTIVLNKNEKSKRLPIMLFADILQDISIHKIIYFIKYIVKKLKKNTTRKDWGKLSHGKILRKALSQWQRRFNQMSN